MLLLQEWVWERSPAEPVCRFSRSGCQNLTSARFCGGCRVVPGISCRDL